MTQVVEISTQGPFFLHSQYYGCWWLGDARSQVNGSNDIVLFNPQYSGVCTRKVDSLVPGMCNDNFKHANFKHSSVDDIFSIFVKLQSFEWYGT